MTVVGLSTGVAVLAWIGLALGLVVAVLVVALFTRVMRPAREIRRYADHILGAGLGIARNLDGVDELQRTHALGSAVPGLAIAYLERLAR